MSSHIIGLAI